MRQKLTTAIVDGIVITVCVVATAMVACLVTGCLNAVPPPAVNPPVIVQAPPPKPPMPTDPYLSLPGDIAAAIKHGEAPIVQHGITTIYPYDADRQYELNCRPMRATQIRLASNEWTNEKNVLLGDSLRWSVTVGDGVVLVKPLDTDQTLRTQGPQGEVRPPAPNMNTNMVLHTSLHDYTFTLGLATKAKPFTEAVAFYYPDEVRAGYAKYLAATKHPEDYAQ